MLYNNLINSIFFVFFLSFFTSFFGLKYLIKYFIKKEEYQPIRKEGLETHILTKSKTPTMGGLVLFFSIFISTFLFCNLKSPYILVFLIILFSFAFIGFFDDLIKIFFKNIDGFKGSKKLIIQLFVSGLSMLFISYINRDYLLLGINIPIINFDLNFSILIVPIYMLSISASANATNITDGLDGLLTIPVIFISLSIQIICFLILNGYSFSSIDIDKELIYNIIIILTSIISTFLCFFIYNHYPAKIFMGDVGSLMIGSILCYISILLKIEFLYFIMSLLFIIEIMSSVLQVSYFKITNGKRLFKIAPFHHLLEKNGLKETIVVKILWLFSFICCLFSLILFILS